ncbi:MAG: SLBB domain-containing protein [bacterium]
MSANLRDVGRYSLILLLVTGVTLLLLLLPVQAAAQQAASTASPASPSTPGPSNSPSWQLSPSQNPAGGGVNGWEMTIQDISQMQRQMAEDRTRTEVLDRLQDHAPKEQSCIERFFSSQAHEQLEQFGYSIFRSAASGFAPPARAPVGLNYIIGPGDELSIYLWGLVENSFQVTVDQNGQIIIPKLGVLSVSGLRLGELKEFLVQQFSRVYTQFKLDASLGRLRSIQVIIAGEVKKPGTYLLSPLATIYHALFQCGGPTKTGTLRAIRRIRQNAATPEVVDLYHFLLNGDRSQDKPLEDGDTIFVPPLGPVVAITGPVKRPGIYEQTASSTVAQLMDLAGGTFLGGRWGVPGVERIRLADGKMPVPKPVAPDDPLEDGDLIRLNLNMVTLSGEVRHPGRFIIQRGERLSSILSKAGGYTEFAYLRGAFFTRQSIQKMQQERLGRYILDLQRETLFSSSRAAEESLSPKDDGQRIEKSLSIENQLLSKLRESQATGRVIIELSPIEKFRGSAADIELEDGDTLYVPRKPSTVTVLGEVYNPTTIVYVPNRRAEYYLQKAGGLTANAEEDNIYIIKADGSIVGKDCTSRFINLHWSAEEKSFISPKTAAACLEPGDTVVVPPRLKSLALKKNVLDWSQVFYQTALGAGVIMGAY